jgi:starch synthase
MNIFHISAECYPVAKAGGLGDVVGALPKYLNKTGHNATVVLPHYHNKWLEEADTQIIFEGRAPFGNGSFAYRVSRLTEPHLGFELILIDIPGRFDRPGVYLDPWSGHPYWDEKERIFSFQIAAMEWLLELNEKPEIVHCHDHHTALVPFMMAHSFRYSLLSTIPTVLTIHNGEYQGRYDMESASLLPEFDPANYGLLDWDGQLNALASGIKTAWKVSTVSEGYLYELQEFCHGLEILLRQEQAKSVGILNGIDTDVWDPASDPYLHENYALHKYKVGKERNKNELLRQFDLAEGRPLISFIGRLVREKGADLLPDLIKKCHAENIEVSFLILGTGDPGLHEKFEKLQDEYTGYFDSRLEYNEGLAHQIYAGSDYLIMPSRVEPCGLNQLYSMRYGTIPIVRNIGGLADTVKDISKQGGYGVVFENFNLDEATEAIKRSVDLFNREKEFNKTRRRIMQIDFSWEKAAKNYVKMYKSMK